MHRENAVLSKVRPLLAKLTGDHAWANCEMFLGPNDTEYFDDRYMNRMYKRRIKESQNHKGDATKTNGVSVAEALTNGGPIHHGTGQDSTSHKHDIGVEDVEMADSDPKALTDQEREGLHVGGPPVLSQNGLGPSGHEAAPLTNGDQRQPGEIERVNGTSVLQQTAKAKGKEPEFRLIPDDEDATMEDAPGANVNGATQSNARSQPSHNDIPSLLATLAEESFIHPIFLAPTSARPDRDLGLPQQEAEELRRLLQSYCQKQEEVCRGSKKLYEGLLKADRQRKTVLGWAKAEAHCGPNRDMSDGEDWYDQEEWGLTEDLKKGQDEEEEDTTQTQKKTRNRGK